MHLSLPRLLTGLSLATAVLAVNQRAINVFQKADKIKALRDKHNAEKIAAYSQASPPVKQQSQPRYLNSVTQKFVVDGSAIPDVDFDIGESYAGLLPISDDPNEDKQLYFWFFPSSNPDASEEVTIWFNGGPGCSSLSGLLTENGPFLYMDGTLAPVPNSYSWTNLTNVLWIEQPIGVGFSQGQPTIRNEVDLGLQFIGFYKQFVEAFQTHNHKVYLTGESYAGYYVPYIADAFITANDTTYYNLAGVGINDPIIGDATIQEQAILLPFVEYWSKLFYFTDSLMSKLRRRQDECGYSSYIEKYLTFPPPAGPFPVLPDPDDRKHINCDMFSSIYSAALDVNPCFNIYHITQTCPTPYSNLGIVNSGDYTPKGATVWFNRSDVQSAINAPVGTNWAQCTDKNVFNYGYTHNYSLGDTSLGPAQNGVLQRVIEYTNNTMIGVGNLDFILPPNGTLFALQNMTWNGAQGFQEYPQQNELYVPFHPEYNKGRLSESGVSGYWGEERGLVFYTVQLSGHELPGFSAGSGYRLLEKLLGRIGNLSEVSDFTTQKGDFQPRGKRAGKGMKHEQYVLAEMDEPHMDL